VLGLKSSNNYDIVVESMCTVLYHVGWFVATYKKSAT
jgi:hypothetical protein